MRTRRTSRRGLALLDVLGSVALLALAMGIVTRSIYSISAIYRDAANISNTIARQTQWLTTLRQDAATASQHVVTTDALSLQNATTLVTWTITQTELRRTEIDAGSDQTNRQVERTSTWPPDGLALSFEAAPGNVVCLMADGAPVPLAMPVSVPATSEVRP
jgi:hypothetical protein